MMFNVNAGNAASEALELLIKKHDDYGPKNIMDSPVSPTLGLAVRLHDKVARLNNLLVNSTEPKYESLRDTFMDISNYGLIGMMVLDGTFEDE